MEAVSHERGNDDVMDLMASMGIEAENYGNATACNVCAVTYHDCDNQENKDGLIVKDLPPRYAMTTSNISESFNNSIKQIRLKSWFDIVDNLISLIIQQNASEYEKWKDSDETEVVKNVKDILKKSWDVEPSYENCCLRSDGLRYAVFRKGSDTRHVLYLEKKYCTCGEWQEHRYPCVHMVVYLRQLRVVECFEDLLDSEYVADIYRQGSVVKCYESNIIPVATTLVECDGETTAPKVAAKAGRPTKKRLRKRVPKAKPDGTVLKKCSNCHEEGHNACTCPRKA